MAEGWLWAVYTGGRRDTGATGLVLDSRPALAVGANEEIGEEVVAGDGGSVGESDGGEPLETGKTTRWEAATLEKRRGEREEASQWGLVGAVDPFRFEFCKS